MSNGDSNSVCRKDIPYPSVSPESAASVMNNLTTALYGSFTKTVVGGRVIWNIPCDPVNAPATVFGLPRNAGEGLLCYFIRAFNAANQGGTTFYGTFIGNLTGNVAGNVTGNLTGNVAGNVTGNLTGNVTGNVTGTSGGIAGGSTNSLVYQSAPSTTSFLPVGTKGQVLTVLSSGTIGWQSSINPIVAALIFG